MMILKRNEPELLNKRDNKRGNRQAEDSLEDSDLCLSAVSEG